MSDTSYAVYEHYGTAAQRLAFTPAPPATGQPLYVWYETDTNDVYFYTTAWHGPLSAGSGGASRGRTVLIGGGRGGVGGGGRMGPPGKRGATGATGATGAAGAPGTGGAIVQVKNTQTGAVATGTTTVPLDDTIPQNTEGTEFLTLAITPTDAAHTLKIEVVMFFTYSTAAWVIAGLFQDSTASALAASLAYQQIATAQNSITFTHYMVAGTTSPTTFKVRAGGQTGGTVTFNGQSGGRLMGGVIASSITITEIVP